MALSLSSTRTFFFLFDFSFLLFFRSLLCLVSFCSETQTDVATDMVSAGLAVVDDKNRRAARAVAQLKAAQESAKNNRVRLIVCESHFPFHTSYLFFSLLVRNLGVR